MFKEKLLQTMLIWSSLKALSQTAGAKTKNSKKHAKQQFVIETFRIQLRPLTKKPLITNFRL